MNIDFVITWCNDEDPEWRKQRDSALLKEKEISQIQIDARKCRFRDWNLLPYWFRSIEKNAPWVHKIFLVVGQAVPSWINVNHPKLQIVQHKDFIPNEYLPTFSSHTIEHNLHRIEGLSECFVYFNDDCFINRPVQTTYFFANNLPRYHYEDSIISPYVSIYQYILFNNMALLNRHFSRRAWLRKNWYQYWKSYSLREFIRKMLYFPLPQWSFIIPEHQAVALKKSTMEKVWEHEENTLDNVCRNSFRSWEDVNQFIYRYWQIAEGQWIPRKMDSAYSYVTKGILDICEYIKHEKYTLICPNDSHLIPDDDFQMLHDNLIQSFTMRYPHKSSYEL